MKKSIIATLMLSLFFLALDQSVLHAVTIVDNYYGADDHNYGDVIGSSTIFDISKMDVDYLTASKKLQVVITSAYFNQLPTGGTNSHTTIGDLFIATGGWNPAGTSSNHYITDKFSTTGTVWNYAAVLDPRVPVNSGDTTLNGTVKLYDVNPANVGLSSGPSGWIWRNGQMVAYTPASGQSQIGTTGEWTITKDPNNIYGMMTLLFDVSKLDITTESWGLHWAMSCANDVIEGAFPMGFTNQQSSVPEPGTFILLGAGLSGLFFLRRKSSKED